MNRLADAFEKLIPELRAVARKIENDEGVEIIELATVLDASHDHLNGVLRILRTERPWKTP